MNAKGDITVKSDAVREVLEYAQKLVKFLPADAVSYDDASNNRALISGKSALIWNPPSAWAVAKRDAPTVAADCWTFPAPTGPKGRFVPLCAVLLGRLEVRQNKSAAKELIEYLMQREQVEARCNAVARLRHPAVRQHADFKIWDEVEPPKGTVYQLPDPQVAASGEAASRRRRRRRISRCRSTTAAPLPTMFAKLQERPVDQAGDRLGAGRAGRLHALTASRRAGQGWRCTMQRQPLAWLRQ